MSCWFALLSRDHVCASCFAPTPKSREVLQRRVEELRRRGQLVPRRDFLPRCGWRGPSLPQTSNRFLFDFLCEVSLLKFNCQQKRVHFFPHGNPRDVHCSQSFAVAILCFRPKGEPWIACLDWTPNQVPCSLGRQPFAGRVMVVEKWVLGCHVLCYQVNPAKDSTK